MNCCDSRIKQDEKRSGVEELKKEPVTVFLILVNVLVFLVVEFTG